MSEGLGLACWFPTLSRLRGYRVGLEHSLGFQVMSPSTGGS